MTEKMLPWSEVVSGDYVWSTKKNQWYEVQEIWPLPGDRVQWKPRYTDIEKPFKMPASSTIKVRRSDMGTAVSTLNTILYSGPNGLHDPGTDQNHPFFRRVHAVRASINAARGSQGLPAVGWMAAKQQVLDELHAEAEERNR